MNRLFSFPALALGLLAVVLVGCGGNALDVVFGVQGILGLLHLIAVIVAFVQIFNSHLDTGSKVLWALAVFFFPLVGLLLWFFIGSKS